MGFGGWLRRAAKAVLPPAIFLSLVAYFLWNATQGERGLQAYPLRQQQLKQVKAEYDRTEAEGKLWDGRGAGVRSQGLDPDILDELAGAIVNLAHPADIVVPMKQGPR